MPARDNPAQKQSQRDELRREIKESKEVSFAMMPLTPGDLRGIFAGLKSFSKRFPEHAEGLIGRVQKMLKATDEEMAARMKVRPRDDWQGYAHDAPTPGWRRKNAWDAPPAAPTETSPIVHPTPVRQEPNAARSAEAAAKATEKIITRVKAAIKTAPKE